MEVLKRKILIEDSVDRSYNSPTWGELTATTFYLKINLTQNMDDMGLFTDIEYIPKDDNASSQPDYTLLSDKLAFSGISFPFMNGATNPIMPIISGTSQVTLRPPTSYVSDYYRFGNLPITGYTDSKIEDVKSYDENDQFRIGFNTHTETYLNYNDLSIDGVDRIKTMGEPKIYVFDTVDDSSLGTENQVYGLQYLEYTGISRSVVIDNIRTIIPTTKFRFIGEGFNETNTSLSALTKEEYLFGIISKPEVQSDVFIDRGQVTVMDMHLRLSEIKNLGELERYGNGYYKLNKQ